MKTRMFDISEKMFDAYKLAITRFDLFTLKNNSVAPSNLSKFMTSYDPSEFFEVLSVLFSNHDRYTSDFIMSNFGEKKTS